MPSRRTSRRFHMIGAVANCAGSEMAGGLRQLATGQPSEVSDPLLIPSNAPRLI